MDGRHNIFPPFRWSTGPAQMVERIIAQSIFYFNMHRLICLKKNKTGWKRQKEGRRPTRKNKIPPGIKDTGRVGRQGRWDLYDRRRKFRTAAPGRSRTGCERRTWPWCPPVRPSASG